jgi:thymidylate synthase (FAD)
MNKLLYTKDDIGFVELINHTKDGDLLVVNAARCSFDKQHEEFNYEKDSRLIYYLAKHEHLLPFRHPSITLRLYTPIFVLRQLGKHQVGFSWSEVSRRYITGEPEFWYPEEVRTRPENIKQGSVSGGWETKPEKLEESLNLFSESKEAGLQIYNSLLERGVAPEQARAVLPQSMYTTCVVTGTLLGWYHLYNLRTEEHTQLETQEYARLIGDIMSELCPMSWEALTINGKN